MNQRTAFWRLGDLGRDWPDGRGIFVSHDSVVVGWSNEEEHLQLLAVDYEGDIEKVCTRLWDNLGEIETKIARRQGRGFDREAPLRR